MKRQEISSWPAKIGRMPFAGFAALDLSIAFDYLAIINFLCNIQINTYMYYFVFITKCLYRGIQM